MSFTSTTRLSTSLRISIPPPYSSLSSIIISPAIIHTTTQHYSNINAITEKPYDSQRLLGRILDKAKYEKTASSSPCSSYSILGGDVSTFVPPCLTGPGSDLLGKLPPPRYSSPEDHNGAAHVLALASPHDAPSPRMRKEKYNESSLTISVISPILSQDLLSLRAPLLTLHTPVNTSTTYLGSPFCPLFSPPTSTVDIPLTPEAEVLASIIPDPSTPGMTVHAPVPYNRPSRGRPRLSPLERGAREMLGESAPETRLPSPQERYVPLYQCSRPSLSPSLSPPQSRFSVRLRRLAPPALQLVPTQAEFSSPGSSASISNLRILQASSAQQGTTTIGLGINVPKITQPEVIQQQQSPIRSPQVTRSGPNPEHGEVEDQQYSEYGRWAASSPLDYMDFQIPAHSACSSSSHAIVPPYGDTCTLTRHSLGLRT